MKKFLANILFFFCTIIIIDISFGLICDFLNTHAKSGDTKSHFYVAKKCEEDILVFGSSRALHHYVPAILEDSLGLSVYNCGCDGKGVIYHYCNLRMIIKRYCPKIIIYDVTSAFDITESDTLGYLGLMRRYAEDEDVRRVFRQVDCREPFKMLSGMYRYNGSLLALLGDYTKTDNGIDLFGYIPKYDKLKSRPSILDVPENREWDILKYKLLDDFVKICKNNDIKLVFVFSPSLGHSVPPCENLLLSFASNHHVPVIDFYSYPPICDNCDFFYDSVHMNHYGAEEFSKRIISELKNKLNI